MNHHSSLSVGLFQQFMDDATYAHEKPKDRPPRNKRVSPTSDHPEHQVSWFDAVMFCNWLSRRERLTPCYRQIDVTTW